MISESSKSMLKQCGDAVNGVTERRKLLEGARTKLDEMSRKIIKGVVAAITKASEDAVEKQFKLVEERLVASVVKGIEKAVKEDLFYSTLPPESMKELKDVAVTKSTKRAAEATDSSDVVELGSLLGQAHVEKASTVVAARHEKSKKPKVIVYTPPPPPDDQGKTRGCKAPFKELGMMSRKGKPVSEQTVGSRKRFLGTFETEANQKFCTAICWHVYFPDIDLKEYEGFTAQDEKDWKVYLDTAARMPTGVWSVAQEQGECHFDE
ncbi:unnamed protein product [Closterium sp. Naga37s-1]|nr:unnamed protein product [Closterium sp. Naga37s-1]